MKVIIEKSGSIEDVINMLDKEGLVCREDSGFIRDDIIEGGSGIYELGFGCVGEEFIFVKSDNYFSKEELMSEDNKEFLDEFYNDNNEYIIDGDYDFVKSVSYFEEMFSVFVKVEV